MLPRHAVVIFLSVALAAHAQPATSNESQEALKSPNEQRPPLLGQNNTGVFHVGSALLREPKSLQTGLSLSYFRQNDFPVRSTQNELMTATLALSYTPLKWLETYAVYQARQNQNAKTSPAQIRSLANVSLGVKGTMKLMTGLSGGVELTGLYLSGVPQTVFSGGAFGIAPQLLLTWNGLESAPALPLRAHLNVGGVFDNAFQRNRGNTLSAAQEFALNLNRYHRVSAKAAIEWVGVFNPFLEYQMAYPLGVPGGQLNGPDGNAVSVISAMPQILTLGAKWSPTPPFSLATGIDIGLSQRAGLGVPATPPWNVFLAVAYNARIQPRSDTTSESQSPQTLSNVGTPTTPLATQAFSGIVLDAVTRTPIPGAVVSEEGDGAPLGTSDATGKFVTTPLAVGMHQLIIQKDGFVPLRQWIKVGPEIRTPSPFALEPLSRTANVTVVITANQKPFAAKLILVGKESMAFQIPARSAGARIVVPAGSYAAEVTVNGYLAQTRVLNVVDNAPANLSFDLIPVPARKAIAVTDASIQLLQPIRFNEGTAVLQPDSRVILQQVVDALVRNRLKKLRVEGYTDNEGGKMKNLLLSRDQARAVVNELVNLGVERTRLEAKGYGEEKPIAPNLTPKGRQLNRRIEFVILKS